MLAAWKTREQLIQEMKNLADNNPSLCSYQSIGKTVLGNDIWLFRVGTNINAKILVDGTTHGMEQAGGHCIMHLMQWLLGTSAEANYVRSHMQVLLVPIVNYDKYQPGGIGKPSYRKNARPDPTYFPPTGYGCVNWDADPPQCSGVDVNRNHIRGWSPGSDTLSPYYSGPSAGREPETQAINALIQAENPKVYVTIHDFGGTVSTHGDFRYPNYGNPSYASSCIALHNEYASLVQSLGFTPHTRIMQSAYGSSRDDGYNDGMTVSALWEETGGDTVTPDLIRDNKAKHLIAFVMACAQQYGVEPQKSPLPLLLLATLTLMLIS